MMVRLGARTTAVFFSLSLYACTPTKPSGPLREYSASSSLCRACSAPDALGVVMRLTVEKRELYEAQAMAAELPLSTYLRNRLEREDAIMDELQMLRRAVERMKDQAPGDSQHRNGLQGMEGVVLEMLLTLRQLAGAKNDLAQKEIARQGYEVWSAT